MFACSLLAAILIRQEPVSNLFFVRSDSIYKLSQGHESLVLKHAVSPAVSPDLRYLAFIRDGNLYTYDFAKALTHKCTNLPDKPDDIPDHDVFPSWDADSTHIVFSHPDRYSVIKRGESVPTMFGEERSSRTLWNIYWYWVQTPTVKPGLSLFLGNETSGSSSFAANSSLSGAFSPDGRRVAFCRNGDLWIATMDRASIHSGIREASWDEARVWACGTQEGGTRGTNETTSIFRISWSPDGKLLALSSDRYGSAGSAEVTIVKADRPSEKMVSFGGSDACFLDDNHVIYVKPYSQSQDIWQRDLNTQDEKVVIVHATEPAVLPRG